MRPKVVLPPAVLEDVWIDIKTEHKVWLSAAVVLKPLIFLDLRVSLPPPPIQHLTFSFSQQTWWFLLWDHVGGLWDWQFHQPAVITVHPLADRVSLHRSVCRSHLHHLHQPERPTGYRTHRWGESAPLTQPQPQGFLASNLVCSFLPNILSPVYFILYCIYFINL